MIVQRLLAFHWQVYLQPVITFGALILAVTSVIALMRYLVRWWLTWRQPMVSLVLTPPATMTRPIEETEKLFTALHSLLLPQTFSARVVGLTPRLALEIVSSRTDGVRFMLRAPAGLADPLEHVIAGFIAEVRISDAADPLHNVRRGRLLRFRQKLHYAYPLQTSDVLSVHDPISYLTNAMTKLAPDELMALQMVIQPTHKREVTKLSRQIQQNQDVLATLSRVNIFGSLLNVISSGLMLLTDSLSDMFYSSASPQNYNRPRQYAAGKPERRVSSFEHELLTTLDTKISKPLFTTTIRALVVSNTKQAAKLRLNSITAAMNLYSVSKYQQLLPTQLYNPLRRRLTMRAVRMRLPSLRSSVVLATHELASLYHFPTSTNTKTDNLITSLSRTLPAPVSLKNGSLLDIVLGENDHHGVTTPIGLTAAERERHIYIVGGTGNGKTTLLLYGIIQDIAAGKGLAVIDPHGDLAETILSRIPKERVADVIYLNPDDLSYPIGVNLLEMKPGLSGDALLREKDLITESVISVMRKIFSNDDSGGHRIEYVLRNTIQTALTLPGSTLFTIFRLLNDTQYRRKVVKTLEDQDLQNFWNHELGKAGDFQKVKMVAGITSKIGRFLFSASARRMLEQEKSSIDFEDILDSGKILICNFSKGLLGEDTSTLFGTTVLAKLQVAALRRSRQAQTSRTPFYLYVDEFQNFATMSFVQMLSEARKYKLYLTMAEQSTAQQEQQRLVDIILANVGTTICFRTGSPADEWRLLPLFKPSIQEGELANLPAYNFYMRIAALDAQEPLSGRTVLLGSLEHTDMRDIVVASSRRLYGLDQSITTLPDPASAIDSTQKQKPRSNGYRIQEMQ
jgi:hypothetical protein